MKKILSFVTLISLFFGCNKAEELPTQEPVLPEYPYNIVDTGVKDFYNDVAKISMPSVGDNFYGQDATYTGNQTSYTNNGDGTITDNVTGLMWEKDMGTKITYTRAFTKADDSTLGGHEDWRVPSIKEIYSLILFTGQVKGETAREMFIDTDYFDLPLGGIRIGGR